MSRICCWQPVLTPHQSHTLRAFGSAMEREVRVISCAPDIAVRREQGWSAHDPSIVPVEILPERGWRARIAEIIRDERDSIHVFGSPFERSRQNFALALALWQKCQVYLISEPYSPVAVGYLGNGVRWKEQVKTMLRPNLYQLYGRLLRKRLKGVFAISPAAVSQFETIGIDRKRIFPFGYFVPLPPAPERSAQDNRGLKVAYLGSFIDRKGVATLVEAFSCPKLREAGASLTLFGGEVPAKYLPIGMPIRSGGRLAFGDVQETLSNYDLLVVPSLYDGWAVVVNEAVGAGVPVLASDMVGATQMVLHWGCGASFASGNADSLAGQLVEIAASRRPLDEWRGRTHSLAKVLQPDIAGAYMRDCIDAVRADANPPVAPWY